jgi:hypothetical protein
MTNSPYLSLILSIAAATVEGLTVPTLLPHFQTYAALPQLLHQSNTGWEEIQPREEE